MTLQRGDVVRRGDRIGVVWDHRPESFSVLPICRPEFGRRSDVPVLDLADRIAVQAMGDMVIQAGRVLQVALAGQVQIGAVSGHLMCRVVQAIARDAAERAAVARWSGDRRHRQRNRPIEAVP